MIVPLFVDIESVLEVGSSTGQQAVCSGVRVAHLVWQPSCLVRNHHEIRQWCDEAALFNAPNPVSLDHDALWPV
ncbi:MAG: DUF938 domain-containing protein [Betaproteobacteria bacterium]|nr:MAG: DUF938 domain-containing protein [Betaproteobacteria bacterium]